MRTFQYKGFTYAGDLSRGLIEAFDPKEAREKLATQGILAERVEPVSRKAQYSLFRRDNRFNLEMRAIVYREMESLLRAGLPLVNALQVLIDSPEFGDDRSILAAIRDQVQGGGSLADALADASGQVTSFEKSVIEVGERAGTLDEVLNRLATFLEEQQRVKEKLQTALIYPSIIIALTIAVGIVMMGLLIPHVGELLMDSNVELPFITRATLALGEASLWITIPLVLIAVAGGMFYRWKAAQDPAFVIRMDQYRFKLPFLGKLRVYLVNMRFARTLSLLLDGGVPLIEGMGLAGRATGSPWVNKLITQETESVRHGSTLADAVRKIGPLRETLPGWIQAGEASGNLESLLDKAGQRYQQNWDRLVQRTLATLEPLLILLVGLFVLLISLAVLLPVFSLSQTLI